MSLLIWPKLTRIDSQVLLTPTHLAIVMDYAAGGELFEKICNAGKFTEDEVEIAESAILLIELFVRKC